MIGLILDKLINQYFISVFVTLEKQKKNNYELNNENKQLYSYPFLVDYTKTEIAKQRNICDDGKSACK